MTAVRRFPVSAFFVLACLVGWYPYIVAFFTGATGAENFPLGPGLAALVVLACLGREELRAWGRRIRDWRASTRWYLVALLVPLAVQRRAARRPGARDASGGSVRRTASNRSPVWYVVASRRRRITARRLDESPVAQYAVSS